MYINRGRGTGRAAVAAGRGGNGRGSRTRGRMTDHRIGLRVPRAGANRPGIRAAVRHVRNRWAAAGIGDGLATQRVSRVILHHRTELHDLSVVQRISGRRYAHRERIIGGIATTTASDDTECESDNQDQKSCKPPQCNLPALQFLHGAVFAESNNIKDFSVEAGQFFSKRRGRKTRLAIGPEPESRAEARRRGEKNKQGTNPDN